MMLLISLILALIPLLGIAWILLYGTVWTVDGLFMSLILLTISGVFALNVLLEFRKGKTPANSSRQAGARGAAAGSGLPSSGLVQRGTVRSIEFFESHVGQPNKSVVVLANGSNSSRTLILDGDVRNALPVGRTVEITIRKDDGSNVLSNVS